MFDAPTDGLVLWAALSVASVAVSGVALSVTGPPPPDAATVAGAIDQVATSPNRVADSVRVRAAELRIAASQVSLRGPGGTDHARLVAGAVTPAENGPLRRVLNGTEPVEVFRTPGGFRRALSGARDRWSDWRDAPDRLQIRRVAWRGIDATLVG